MVNKKNVHGSETMKLVVKLIVPATLLFLHYVHKLVEFVVKMMTITNLRLSVALK